MASFDVVKLCFISLKLSRIVRLISTNKSANKTALSKILIKKGLGSGRSSCSVTSFFIASSTRFSQSANKLAIISSCVGNLSEITSPFSDTSPPNKRISAASPSFPDVISLSSSANNLLSFVLSSSFSTIKPTKKNSS